jgi:hypothetical protein
MEMEWPHLYGEHSTRDKFKRARLPDQASILGLMGTNMTAPGTRV